MTFELVTILITPPTEPLPYKVAPPPGITSIFLMVSMGIEFIGRLAIVSSVGLILTPSTRILTLLRDFSPLPLISTLGPKAVLLTTTPGESLRTSSTFL